MSAVHCASKLEALMALVLELNQHSVRCHSIEQYFAVMHQGLQPILLHQRVRLFSTTPDITLVAQHTSASEPCPSALQPTAFLHWFIEHPQPLHLQGVHDQASQLPSVDCQGLAACCLVYPLFSMQQQLTGCLLVEHQQQAFADTDLALLQLVAQQLSTTWCSLTMQAQLNTAIALRTAELEHQVALRTRAGDVQHTLFEISSMSGAATNRDQLYQQLHQSISQLLMAKNFVIALYDSSSDEISLEYFRDQFDAVPHQKCFPVGQGMTSFVIRSRQGQLISPARLQQLIDNCDIVQALGNTNDLASWMGAPMLMNDRVYGVVIIQSYQADVVYTDHDLELLLYLARHMASALERFFQDEALRASKAELARQNVELQQTVASLRQAELELARREKLAAVGQMAAGIAHQINTPLGFMHCNLELELHFIDQLAAYCAPAGQAILTEMQQMQSETMQGCQQISRIVRELRQYSEHSDDTFSTYRIADAFDHVMHLLSVEHQQRIHLPASMAVLEIYTRPAIFDQVLLAVCQHLCQHWLPPIALVLDLERRALGWWCSFRALRQGQPALLDIKMATEFLADSQQLLSLSVAQHQMMQAGGELTWLGSPQACYGFALHIKAASDDAADFSI